MKQPDVDKSTISMFARMATNCQSLQIDTWEKTSLSVQGQRSIFRFAGIGMDGAIKRPWSVVLKQIQAPEDPKAPDAAIDHCAYWEREYLLYKSDIPQSITSGIRAPRCFGTAQTAPDLRWIWLEDLHDRYNGEWPFEEYAKTAYSLGIFNGEYLVKKPIPVSSYLASHALRCSSRHHISEFNRYRDPSLWKHPLLQRAYPQPVIETLDQLAADREKLLAVVENLPQTFCHLDAWHGNMAVVENTDQSNSTVLFDWALAGYGAVGEEIATLIWVALLEFKVDIQNAERLEAVVFNQYLQGLEASGWQYHPIHVRIAYLINSVLLFGFQLEAVDHAINEDAYQATEQLYKQAIDRLVTQAAQVTYLLIKRIHELRALLDHLSR